MSRPVSLTVHRNNRAQRKAKRVRAMFKDDMRNIIEMSDIAGYAVVAWDTERGYRSNWYTPKDGPMPGAVMPEYVKVSLLRDIGRTDACRILGFTDDDEAS